MTCAKCGSPAAFRCCHRYRRLMIVLPLEIAPGDIYDASDGRRYVVRETRVVLLSDIIPAFDFPMVERQIVRLTVQKDGQPHYWYVDHQHLHLIVSRTVVCGEPICENHAQDLGDDEHYHCPKHWNPLDIELDALRYATEGGTQIAENPV